MEVGASRDGCVDCASIVFSQKSMASNGFTEITFMHITSIAEKSSLLITGENLYRDTLIIKCFI